MEKFSQFVDDLLLDMRRFPSTMLKLIVSPQEVLRARSQDKYCSPGIAYFYSIAIVYCLIKVLEVGDESKILPAALSSELMLVFALVFSAVPVAFQRAIVAKVLKPGIDVDQQFKLLFYPLALFVFTVVMWVTALTFLSVVLKLAPGSPSSTIGSALGALVAYAGYMLALLNIFRISFGGSRPRAIVSMVICMIIFHGYIVLSGIVTKRVLDAGPQAMDSQQLRGLARPGEKLRGPLEDLRYR